MTSIENHLSAEAAGFRMIHRADVKPWAGQPRKHFAKERIEALAEVMRARGFDEVFPLLVRPVGNSFEIADGECRWRAAELAGIEVLPCVVRSMGDAEMFELAMISSVQKKELLPMEEALGIARMLDFKGEDGAALYTRETLAKALGMSVGAVGDKLALVRLTNSAVGEALDDGLISPAHARLISRIPTSAVREKVLAMVLRPAGCGTPMPVSDLKTRLTLDFMRELRGVEWSLDDAELVPVVMERGERVGGGACTGCPFNQVNEGSKRKDGMCMSPECFRAKEEALHKRWAARKAAEGRSALSFEENARAFASNGVSLAYSSPFVDLDEKPMPAEIGAPADVEIAEWKRLLAGVEVPVVMARDGKGRERALVDRALAVTTLEQLDAARPEGERILAPKRKALAEATPEQIEAAKVALEKEKAERAKEDRIFAAQTKAVVEASRKTLSKAGAPWLSLVLYNVAVLMADVTLLEKVCAAHGWKDKGTPLSTFKAATKDMPEHFAVELLTEMLMLVEPDEIALWADAVGFARENMSDIRKRVTAELKAEKSAVQAAKVDAEFLTWENVRDSVDDFEWNEHGVCKQPDVGTLALKGVDAKLKVAVCARGWVFGISVAGKTYDSVSPCTANGTAYDSRSLVTMSALKAVQKALARNDAAAAEMVKEYIAKAKKEGK